MRNAVRRSLQVFSSFRQPAAPIVEDVDRVRDEALNRLIWCKEEELLRSVSQGGLKNHHVSRGEPLDPLHVLSGKLRLQNAFAVCDTRSCVLADARAFKGPK